MGNRTIIHVGLHKTASTLLQEKVFPQVKGFRYLTRPYTQFNISWNQLQYADDTLYDADLMESLLRPLRMQNLLISDESLSGNPTQLAYSNRSMIAHRLKNHFPEAEIILVIRGQQDIICSQYNMWVKGSYRGYRSISDFLWLPDTSAYTLSDAESGVKTDLNQLFVNLNKAHLHAVGYNYYELVKLYKLLFKKVHVLLFEDIDSDSGGVAHRLGVIFNQPELAEKVDFSGRVNRSIAKDELREKIFENRAQVISKRRPVRWLVKNYLKYFSGGTVDPKTYVYERTKDFYRDNNRRLLEEFPEIGIDRYPEKYLV